MPVAPVVPVAPPDPWQTDETLHAPLPGSLASIANLPADHTAVQYLTGRGFDCAELAAKYDVAYVTHAHAKYRTAQGRILTPIYKGDVLRSWQARAVGETPTPKYYSLRGSRIRGMLYRVDEAADYPWAVVVEGVTGVWRLGAPAIATFGSGLAALQIAELRKRWPRGVVFLHDVDVYDAPEKTAKAAEKRNAAFSTLKAACPGSVDIRLPANRDAANFTRERLWAMILKHATAAGLTAFEPPA